MKRTGSRASLFLMEMIIVILFFALTAAICVGLFANAHLSTVQSDELMRAVMILQSDAERFKAGEYDSYGVFLTGYDSDWNEVGVSENTPYIRRVEISSDGALDEAHLALLPAGGEDPIFELTAKRFKEVA